MQGEKYPSVDAAAGGPGPNPELVMTEPDSNVDPDSDDEPERKDSLDVHEEGQY